MVLTLVLLAVMNAWSAIYPMKCWVKHMTKYHCTSTISYHEGDFCCGFCEFSCVAVYDSLKHTLKHTYTYTQADSCTHTHTHACTHTHTHTHMHACIHVERCANTHVYAQMHIPRIITKLMINEYVITRPEQATHNHHFGEANVGHQLLKKMGWEGWGWELQKRVYRIPIKVVKCNPKVIRKVIYCRAIK